MRKFKACDFEKIKRIDMVEFLTRHYGLDFSNRVSHGQVGRPYCCLSPFTNERRASFFVRVVDDHWLFKDFSSGYGGSLIDFVLLKEGFSQPIEALNHIVGLLGRGGEDEGCSNRTVELPPSPPSSPAAGPGQSSSTPSPPPTFLTKPMSPMPPTPPTPPLSSVKEYDINDLYSKFRRNDVSHCRDYLFKRGISEEVIDELCSGGLLVHNRYKDISYCCFAVFAPSGDLCCLDNHQIDGEEKFVLGTKHPFSMDWAEFGTSQRVFFTESIIDYLSMKTLEGIDFPGLALLGNAINFNGSLFPVDIEIVSAFDGDAGGFSAFLDLDETFNGKMLGYRVSVYDFGDSKDANEYLQAQHKRLKVQRLNAQDKLLLYRDFQRSTNKSKVAKKWGINRSYMYEVVKECEDLIISGFSHRRSGRRSSQEPRTLAEAVERLKNLEEENRRLDEERERHYVRNEFMKIRLKWAQSAKKSRYRWNCRTKAPRT